jgi:hypothetical protein
MKRLFATFVAICFHVTFANGQPAPNPASTSGPLTSATTAAPIDTSTPIDIEKADDFRKLFAEREQLLGHIQELDQQIYDLWAKIQNLPPAETLGMLFARQHHYRKRSVVNVKGRIAALAARNNVSQRWSIHHAKRTASERT